MAVQTPVHVSILTKILQYFELAASIGVQIPNAHVDAIFALMAQMSADLLAGQSRVATSRQSVGSEANVALKQAQTAAALVVPLFPAASVQLAQEAQKQVQTFVHTASVNPALKPTQQAQRSNVIPGARTVKSTF